FALLPEDRLLKPQQRDLLLLQHAHYIEQSPQEPVDHSLILLVQFVLPDFLDQGIDFGRIDFGYLVVRFSHSSHTSALRGTIAGRSFSMCGAELSPSFCPHHFSNSRAFAEASHFTSFLSRSADNILSNRIRSAPPSSSRVRNSHNTEWSKPGSSSSRHNKYFQSMRPRTASAAPRSDNPSINCKTVTRARRNGGCPGCPCCE